jgi:hypothetical protein
MLQIMRFVTELAYGWRVCQFFCVLYKMMCSLLNSFDGMFQLNIKNFDNLLVLHNVYIIFIIAQGRGQQCQLRVQTKKTPGGVSFSVFLRGHVFWRKFKQVCLLVFSPLIVMLTSMFACTSRKWRIWLAEWMSLGILWWWKLTSSVFVMIYWHQDPIFNWTIWSHTCEWDHIRTMVSP